MKKLLCLFSALVLLFSCAAAGCDKSGSPEAGTPEQTSPDVPGTPDTPDVPDEPDTPDTPDEGGDDVERVPRELPADFKYGVKTEQYSVYLKDSDVELYGKLYLPKAEGKFPLVVCSHGFNGHYSDFERECTRFAERGYVAYGFDFAGASVGCRSTGRTSLEMTIFTMISDLEGVIDDLSKFPEVDKTQVFLFGGSQGGLVSALTAAKRKDTIAGLAMYFPAINIPDDWRRTFPDASAIPETYEPYNWGLTLGRDYFLSIHDFDPFEVIGDFKKDTLILWGTADAIVPRSYMTRAVETYEHAELVELAGEGHGFSPEGVTKALPEILEYLESHTFEPI